MTNRNLLVIPLLERYKFSYIRMILWRRTFQEWRAGYFGLYFQIQVRAMPILPGFRDMELQACTRYGHSTVRILGKVFRVDVLGYRLAFGRAIKGSAKGVLQYFPEYTFTYRLPLQGLVCVVRAAMKLWWVIRLYSFLQMRGRDALRHFWLTPIVTTGGR